jgi:hypothetical protein
MDTLEGIRENLDRLQKEYGEKQAIALSNREAAIAFCHFLYDTLSTIDPDRIDVSWYGSYHNASVADYPVVKICATYRRQLIASWHIDTGGSVPAPNITFEDVLRAVKRGLDNIHT